MVFFVIAIIVFLQIVKKTIYKVSKFDSGKKITIYSLIRYITLVIASVFALDILGFNPSVFIAGSAALLVGVGLGLQNLFSDFVSGIILLIDATIKVNDIIEVNGLVCKVQEIKLRTTKVLTRDDKYIILPNSDLTRNQIINWTHSNIDSRFEITVGVDYSSDVQLVMKILRESAEQESHVLKHPKPFVRFNDYGDSALIFTVYFWSDEVFRVENIKSAIRVKIYERFKSEKVTIPFPQRVIHTPRS
jgi:small-conductance mechanosensitive channel